MKAELILPIESLRGTLRNDGYFFRIVNGKQIVQRCPNRSGYKPKPREIATRDLFAIRTRYVNKLLKEGSTLSRQEIWNRILDGRIIIDSL